LSYSFEYKDPIIYQFRSGKSDDAFVPFVGIPYKVTNNSILLDEIPVRDRGVQVVDTSATPIKTYYEIKSGRPNEFQYIVNYTTGIVKFNHLVEGKTLNFSYFGRGIAYIPASRVWSKEQGGNVTETLENLIDSGKQAIEGLSLIEDAVKNANETVENAQTVIDNLKYIDEYNDETSYIPNNIVSFEGSSFMNINASTGISPTNEAHWKPMGIKGDVGPDGPQGPEGPQGNQGVQGEPGVSDHTHTNLNVLNKLSENGSGNLTFDGVTIGSPGSSSISIKQITKLSVVPNQVEEINIPQTILFNFLPVEVLKFIPGDENVITNIYTFSNSEQDDFISNPTVDFDGVMKQKTSYSYVMTDNGELGDGHLWTYTMDISQFKEIINLEVV